MGAINVKVVEFGDRPHYQMQWVDPLSGKKKTKSTRVRRTGRKRERKEAESVAAKFEADLQHDRYSEPSKTTWDEFRERYSFEKLTSLSQKARQAADSVFNHLERLINPRLLAIVPSIVSEFQAKLRQQGMVETSIAAHLGNLRAALNWAYRKKLLPEKADIDMPKAAKGRTLMRGRPITGEEFDRMLAEVPNERPKDADVWVHYLTGLWLSGLRLEESTIVSWDGDEPFCIDLSGKHPRFRIYAEAHKDRRDQLLPMTPDFASFLLQTPEDERHGRVFKIDGLLTKSPMSPKRIGRVVSDIGRGAAVIVNKAKGKYGSAQDMRRAFGTRWAPRTKPVTLQLLMRHKNIETTLKYYVQQESETSHQSFGASLATVLVTLLVTVNGV